MNREKVLWITRTSMLIALLIVVQALTAPLGVVLITGSLVNMILVLAVMTCGPSAGRTVAVVSPVVAKLAGIGPFWILIPFIALGNLALVSIWHVVGNRAMSGRYAAALVAGAVGKFIVLYLGIVKFAVPVLMKLPEQKAAIVSATFSFPQLLTALVGGMLAAAALPVLKKALPRRR